MWLLSGNRKGALRSWPDAQKPLLQFERPHGPIDNILETECRLNPGPIWLFRIGADGTGSRNCGSYRAARLQLHCRNDRKVAGDPYPGMATCQLDCASSINAFRLDMPSEVSAEATAWLSRNWTCKWRGPSGVWPAGLPGRGWDGEGRSEWLTTEAPCFGIMHDHPLGRLCA